MTGSQRLSVNIGITGLLMIYTVPLVLVVPASFMSNTEIGNSPASLIFTPSAGAYSRVFGAKFLQALSNSVIIAVGTTMLAVGVATTLSYILDREQSSRSVVVISALIALQMLPAAVAIILQYRVLATLGPGQLSE